ncbi:MAG TPA: GNAT family N-acetyltransferase [Rugosimonospora sp.]
MADYMIHARNAAAMWWALADGHGELLAWTGQVRILHPSPNHALRAIILDAGTAPAETMQRVGAMVFPRSDLPRRIVEDASGTLDLGPYGFRPRFRMAVMLRSPGAASAPAGDGPGPVVVAKDEETLAIAERVIAAVFPPARVELDMIGRTMPARVLDIPGWQVWLGRRSDVPAGGAYTYHDGTSLGVYQVATLPEHRAHGVARSLMENILAAHPDVAVTLTATEQGRPLYESLGFRVISEAVWWVPSPSEGPIG